MAYETLHTLTTLPSNLSRLLGEASWENARVYREGGRGRENVLTVEVFQALDFLPRTPFFGGILDAAEGGASDRVPVLREEVETLRMALLPGDMFLANQPGIQFWVQPDGVFETTSVFGLLEVKRIRGGSFQPEQLAREFVLTYQEARKRRKRPLLLLVLPKAPPVKVKGTESPLHIKEAIAASLPSVLEKCDEGFPPVDELLAEVESSVAYVTWDHVRESLVKSAEAFVSTDDSTSRAVDRIVTTALRAIDWHGKPTDAAPTPHEFALIDGESMSPASVADAERTLVRYFEGGALYTAERDGKFLVITDESAMADLLSEEDLEGLELTQVRAFDTDWSSQDSVDTSFGATVSRFELVGAHAVEVAVPTRRIVERLDVVADVGLGNRPVLVDLLLDALLL